MSDVDRLIGKFEEFQKWEHQEHLFIRQDLKNIHSQLSKLNSFKLKIIGGTSVVLAIGGLLLKFVVK